MQSPIYNSHRINCNFKIKIGGKYMISYNNKEIVFNGCPGCAYGKHEFELDCGMAYENERFTMSQDWNCQ